MTSEQNPGPADTSAATRGRGRDARRVRLTQGELDRELDNLVRTDVVDAGQAATVRDALLRASSASTNPAAVWVEIVGYAGGGLMLMGITTFVWLTWHRWTTDSRLILLVALTVLLWIAATATAGGPVALTRLRGRPPSVRRRVTGVLLALASLAGYGVITELYRSDHTTRIAAAAVGLALALLANRVVPGAPALLASALFSIVLGVVVTGSPTATLRDYGVALMLVGAVWLVASTLRLVAPEALGLGIGALTALWGTQFLIQGASHTAKYVAMYALAVVCFALYQWRRATVLLVFGVLTIAIATPELVSDATHDSLGGPAILMIGGAVLILASLVGLRWDRRLRRNRTGTATTAAGGPAA
jgi:hypothetical protein